MRTSCGSSCAIYFLPTVAIALGALFRDETIATVALVGTVLVTAGAYLTSRSEPGHARPRPGAATRPARAAPLHPAAAGE